MKSIHTNLQCNSTWDSLEFYKRIGGFLFFFPPWGKHNLPQCVISQHVSLRELTPHPFSNEIHSGHYPVVFKQNTEKIKWGEARIGINNFQKSKPAENACKAQ